MDIKIEQTAMAYQMKLILGKVLKEYISSSNDECFSDLKKINNEIELVNELKDNYTHLKIFLNKNVREILQILGTEVFRKIDSRIHIMFKAYEILGLLKTNKKQILIVDDLRFEQELEFILNINNAPTMEDKILFCLYTLKHLKENTEQHVDDIFVEAFKINKKDIKLNKQLNDILNEVKKTVSNVQKIKETIGEIKPIEKFNIEKIKNMTWQNIIIEYGVVKIFRPLIPRNFETNDINKLKQAITLYASLSEEEINNIKDIYEESGYDFNAENVKEKGFNRANFSHPSETSLQGYFNSFFVNYPNKSELYSQEIEKLKKSVIKYIEKNKNNNFYLLALNGPAGSGKNYITEILKEVISKTSGNKQIISSKLERK